MTILSTWIANRGLNLTESIVSRHLGLPNFQKVIDEKLSVIDKKLDILIEAPFLQAKMYLKENNLEKCKEKLIEAISLNELNLPALSLYTYLLLNNGQTELGIDYLEAILKKFGPHESILSNEIVNIYNEGVWNQKPKNNISPFDIKFGTATPKKIICNMCNIIIHWKEYGSSGGSSIAKTYNSDWIGVYDWNGNFIKSFSEGSPEIEILTEEYLILKIWKGVFFGKQVLKVFRTKDGNEVSTSTNLTDEKIRRLFIQENSRSFGNFESGSEPQLTFAGAKITVIKNTKLGWWEGLRVEPER